MTLSWVAPMSEEKEQPDAHAAVQFTAAELAELNSAVRAFEIKGQRLPDGVLGRGGAAGEIAEW